MRLVPIEVCDWLCLGRAVDHDHSTLRQRRTELLQETRKDGSSAGVELLEHAEAHLTALASCLLRGTSPLNQPGVQRWRSDGPGDAMTLELLENWTRLYEARTPEVALWYDRRHARGQIGEHEDRQRSEVHFAGLKIDGLGQDLVLR